MNSEGLYRGGCLNMKNKMRRLMICLAGTVAFSLNTGMLAMAEEDTTEEVTETSSEEESEWETEDDFEGVDGNKRFAIHISDMICRGVKTPIKIVGLEEAPISNISLKNINITEAKDKCIFEDCNNILMDKVIVNGEEVKLDL